MEPTEVELEPIASDIWAAILGLELKPTRTDELHDPEERVVSGYVQITGDYECAVAVQTSERLAVRAAALMFGMEEDEVGEEEITDTIGELANMTGGNVKSLLSGSCQLSLPTVTTGREYHVSVPGTKLSARRGMDCDGELVLLSLLIRQR